MNEATETLLHEAVERLQAAIRSRDCPAVVALHGQRTLLLSDYDYLRDAATAHAFEHRAAEKAREIKATRWVIVVPQVWLATDTGISARAVSNLPLRDGENEVISWTAFDADDGVDYGFVPYTRRPNGSPVFDEPKIFTEPVHPHAQMPGITLLRGLNDGTDPTAD
ncbi:hypothetical protein [Streptomyces sp. NPDC127098]|uniref:hypothetical protein n=1 Tax=Streptomyces sp. NPDC127098 TaxID=3347137 RepID=UPI003667ED88